MARLPTLKRLLTESFKDQKAWIGQLLGPLNDFMEAVYAALNRQLTLKENLAADVLTAELDGQMPLKLAWTLKVRPTAVLVGNVVKKSGASLALTDAVAVRWSFSQEGALQIDQVVGITPSSSNRYVLTLIAFTG